MIVVADPYGSSVLSIALLNHRMVHRKSGAGFNRLGLGSGVNELDVLVV